MAEAHPLYHSAPFFFRGEIGRLHGIVKARCIANLYVVDVVFLQPWHCVITIYFILTSKSKKKKKKSIVELLTLHLKVLVLVDFRTPRVDQLCCTDLIVQVPDFSLNLPEPNKKKNSIAVCCYSPAKQRLNWNDSYVAVLYWWRPLPNMVKLNIILVMVLSIWSGWLSPPQPITFSSVFFKSIYLQPNVFLNSSIVHYKGYINKKP